MAITDIPTNTVTTPSTLNRTYADNSYRATNTNATNTNAGVSSNRKIGLWLIVVALIVIAAFGWTSYRNRQDTISSMGASSTQNVNSLSQPTARQADAPPINPALQPEAVNGAKDGQ